MPNNNKNQKIRILLTGGGTGGHIFPLLAVARGLRRVALELGIEEPQMLFLGPRELTAETFPPERIEVKELYVGKLRRYFSLATILDFFKLPVAFFQSLFHLYWFMPDIIFAQGGYGSAFPIIVGWFYHIPVVIHESDSVMGLTNRILSNFAQRIFLAFPTSKKLPSNTFIAGNPLREGLLTGTVEEAKRFFGISLEKPVVLIQGGSQGSQTINELVLQALPKLLEYQEIIHITGQGHFEAIRAIALAQVPPQLHAYYHPYPFLDENALANAYASCSLVVSRAGSGSIFEIAAAARPSILIPLPTAASDHQKKNAYMYADTGAAIVLEEENLTPNIFRQRIEKIVQDARLQQDMVEQAAEFARPGAADDIAKEIFKVINV